MAHGHSGMTPIERAVMDLWDDGMGDRAIGRHLGMKGGYVRRILYMYHDEGSGEHDAAIAAGSQSLLAAMRAAA